MALWWFSSGVWWFYGGFRCFYGGGSVGLWFLFLVQWVCAGKKKRRALTKVLPGTCQLRCFGVEVIDSLIAFTRFWDFLGGFWFCGFARYRSHKA